MLSVNPLGLNTGWVWTALPSFSSSYIPLHSSAFSEVASFPFSSLLAHSLSVEACPSFSAPVACATKGHASLVSAGVRGELEGMAWLQMALLDPLLPGVSRQGSKDLSWHKSFLGWRGEALCSVPDKILPILEKQSSRLLTISFWNLKSLLNTKVTENFLWLTVKEMTVKLVPLPK